MAATGSSRCSAVVVQAALRLVTRWRTLCASVASDGEALLLAAEAALPEPAPGPVRRDFKVKPAAVGQAGSQLAARTNGVAALWVGEGHRGKSLARMTNS